MTLIQELDEVIFLTPEGPKSQMAYLDTSLEGEVREWEPVILPTNEAIVRIVYHNEIGRLYAATEGGTIFTSDDKGQSWVKVESGYIEEYICLNCKQ